MNKIKNDYVGKTRIKKEIIRAVVFSCMKEAENAENLSFSYKSEIKNIFLKKDTYKGIKVEVKDGFITVSMFVSFKGSEPVKKTIMKLQKKIKKEIENISDLKVKKINFIVQKLEKIF